MRKKQVLALTATLSLAGVLAFTGMASAHAQKKTFLPAPNSVLATAPKNLDLTYTAALKSLHVVVLNTKGDTVTEATPAINAADSAHVILPLTATLTPGTYTVKWDAVADDGDGTSGRYTFTVAPSTMTQQSVRVFVDGHEVQGGLPAQIINGTTMVSARAMAEAMGKWVDWDNNQRFVVISNSPEALTDLGTFAHPASAAAPTVQLSATANSQSGFDVHVQTTNWTWAPDKVGSAASANQGYARLYVDGHLVNWLYGPWYHLDGLTPGEHDIKVTLNATNHAEYAVGTGDDAVVSDTTSIVQRAATK